MHDRLKLVDFVLFCLVFTFFWFVWKKSSNFSNLPELPSKAYFVVESDFDSLEVLLILFLKNTEMLLYESYWWCKITYYLNYRWGVDHLAVGLAWGTPFLLPNWWNTKVKGLNFFQLQSPCELQSWALITLHGGDVLTVASISSWDSFWERSFITIFFSRCSYTRRDVVRLKIASDLVTSEACHWFLIEQPVFILHFHWFL